MKIQDLLKPEGIRLGVTCRDQMEAIDTLVSLQEKSGNLTDAKAYKDAILSREARGTTAIGMGIAVPHAKTAAAKRTGLSAITVPDGVDYKAFDGAPAKLLFMIAAPEETPDTHLEILSGLMTMLMDPAFTEKLMAADTVDAFLKAIDEKEAEKDGEDAEREEQQEALAEGKTARILAVTSCPTGIAHTFLAAEALEKAARARNLSIRVETDGQSGALNRLTEQEIAGCDCIICATDRKTEMARFDGKPLILTSTRKAISEPDALLDRALSGNAPVYHHAGDRAKSSPSSGFSPGGEKGWRRIYRNLMNGVSHMLPFVIAGGLLTAISFLIDTIAGYGGSGSSSFGSMTPLSALFRYIGGLCMGLMVPVLSGFIAESIADRPGFVVGFTGGLLAANGNAAAAGYMSGWGVESLDQLSGASRFIARFAFQGSGSTVSGFLGGIAAGFIAGGLVLWLTKVFRHLPSSLEGVKSILLIPLLGVLLEGLLMCFLLNPVIGLINTGFSAMLTALADAKLMWLLGLVLGAMMATDMGGPINKAAYVFGTAMLSNAADLIAAGAQVSDPKVQACYMMMASIMAGGMVPPAGIALACICFPDRFTQVEKDTTVTNLILGASFITEGAIPFAAADPKRVIPSCMAGAGAAGLLSAIFHCTLMAPHGGIFVFTTIGNPGLYILAWAAGSVITCVILGMSRKELPEETQQEIMR